MNANSALGAGGRRFESGHPDAAIPTRPPRRGHLDTAIPAKPGHTQRVIFPARA